MDRSNVDAAQISTKLAVIAGALTVIVGSGIASASEGATFANQAGAAYADPRSFAALSDADLLVASADASSGPRDIVRVTAHIGGEPAWSAGEDDRTPEPTRRTETHQGFDVYSIEFGRLDCNPTSPVPEPAAWTLLLLALVMLPFARPLVRR